MQHPPRLSAWLVALLLLCAMGTPFLFADDGPASEEEDEDAARDVLSAGNFSGLSFRSIGPSLMAGRVGDLAVDPKNPSHYYVAACSGGVWKTTNGGTTYKPVFDGQGSYSIGCVTLDPRNPATVWVGTGENNSQRSVSFGDGVYRSRDAGASWEHMGLKASEHIGMITVDPRDSDTVYVASQGPLWRAGGERGLYKTTDGGKTWDRVLHVSDDTGINEVHVDPRNPDVLYASSYQRRRRVWTLINGGPESTIYKSEDAGKTWRKINKGLPGVDMGRIGLGVSPANPDIVYAIVEAAQDKSGFYRSTNRGERWEKRGTYKPTGAQYYNEIVCDPVDPDRVYTLHTIMRVTDDGGATFTVVPRKNRHVDDHALWINPHNTDHLLVGCDGGVYESLDLGAAWNFKTNLPITQFYRVSVDESEPFYFVYGGTQDNNSQGGPSRTTDRAGITNADWFVTVGGDGYETRVDPTDPNIVYSQWQYGGLVRHDRRSGERLDIKPREKPDEEPLRWNWDSPLILSAHQPTRLYFAANKLFRTDDRGNSWKAISGDLTRGLDRNTLEVMGRIQSIDAVAKDDSTSYFGNCVSLDESPKNEDILYVGTDDGLIQVTEDAGTTWRKTARFPGVPEMAYVSCLTASPIDQNTVFAAFDNHKNGDFKPYVLISRDRGRTWRSIASNLPDRHIVLSILQDHVNPQLLFAGTEFGVFFTVDGGGHWTRLKGGLPTIAVRDMVIQKRENDLVLGTFGRGFYILDDYTPLRTASRELLEKEAALFPVKDAWRYVERSRLGNRNGKGWQGASFYTAPNPAFGAVFTYHLQDKLRTRREARRKGERDAGKAGKAAPFPSIEDLRAEDKERDPIVLLVVRDDTGVVVQRVPGPRGRGFHRVAWNLRYPASNPTRLAPEKNPMPWSQPAIGPLALPGTYTVQLIKVVDGIETSLGEAQSFDVVPLEVATFAAEDKVAVLAFRRRAASLQRAVLGAARAMGEAQARLRHLRQAVVETPRAKLGLLAELDALQARMDALKIVMQGDGTLRKHDFPSHGGVQSMVGDVTGNQWRVTSAPTETQRAMLAEAETLFSGMLARLRVLVDEDLVEIESRLEAAGAPWTPGRLPTWEGK
ncbi:MAG: glycosyl hydrolase [bacterium]|nr:glycosyl hydrolase [bacterium]